MTSDGGFILPLGSEEDAGALVGVAAPPRYAPHPVNPTMVKHYCALTQDPNPHYWEPETGVPHWGGEVTPPAMTMVWLQALPWTPEGGSIDGTTSLAPNVPLPGTSLINVSTETTFWRPIYRGQHLNAVEELIDVSERKQTRLGVGHFLTTRITYRTQDGHTLATSRNVLLRYTPKENDA